MLQGGALKDAARRLATELRAKIEIRQGGVGTFSDHVWLAFITHLEQLEDGRAWEESALALPPADQDAFRRIQRLLTRRAQGRFVDYEERLAVSPKGDGQGDIGYFEMAASQGVVECVQWKGLPLFKTVYDFTLYPMLLWDLKPRTIIELGSGSGASALWLADLTDTFGADTLVYSVDLKQPVLQHQRVRFVEGDCDAIDTVFDREFLTRIKHPVLLIEDAHVNVYGVLRHFHQSLTAGDYVIVEDSAGKQEELVHFLRRQPGCYKVDTYYTDFFGRNATCAQDSILVRTAND